LGFGRWKVGERSLEADVSSSSFSTAVLLVGLELEPEEGERKAMNEFFLDGFAECDLFSGDKEAGEGRVEERVCATSRPAMPPTTMRGEVEDRRKGLSSGRSRDIRGLDALLIASIL